MVNDLLDPADLEGYPGAPFTEQVVDAAVAALRSAAGWHIAPSKTETMTLDSDGANRLALKTLHLTNVAEVRNVFNDNPTTVSVRFSRSGVLSGCFPCGFQSVEVDVTHGYTECPPELIPVVAELSQRIKVDASVASQTSGPFNVTYRDSPSVTTGASVDSRVARYSLAARP